MMTRMTSIPDLRSASLLLLATSIAFAQDVPFSDGDPNFMFIGNSYTGQNSLSGVFKEILKDGIPEWADTVYLDGVNPGGHTLGSHYDDMINESDSAGEKLKKILVDDPVAWKWVTLQDQSQVPGFYQWNYDGTEYYRSTQAAIKFNDYIAAAGGQTMFYMTWGRRDGDRGNLGMFGDFLEMQDKLEEGYKLYRDVTSTSGRPTYIAPVGLAFKTIYLDELDANMDPLAESALFHSLYTNDGSHPTIRGTYVAALTIFTSMTGISPNNINWFPADLDEATGRILQDAVSRTILETLEDPDFYYPWTEAFPVGTSPPTTPAPVTQPPTTQAPVTQPPTTAPPTTRPPTTQPPTTPAPGPGNSNNRGKITITFQYDEYPEEISWTLVRQGAPDPLYFQPFLSPIGPNSTVSKTFNNLEQGRTYEFRVRDSESDGLCCSYGQGSFTIFDEVTGRPLLHTMREFQGYFEVFFKILPNGRAQWKHRSGHYRPGTWEDMEEMIAPTDEGEWPGRVPSQPSHSLMINVDLDENPEDLSWTLYHQDENRQWQVVNQWDGNNASAGALDSTEFSNLDRGWYRFIVKDAKQNGLCCDFGRGFVSITGPLGSADGLMGLVWGNNGQFMGEEEIFFRIGMLGRVSHISWTEI